MKNIFAFIVAITFVACNNPNSGSVEKKNEKRKIDPFLEEIFVKKYSNYTDNQIVRENAIEEFDKKIDSLIELGILNDIPLKVLRIQKNPHGKGALIQFYTDNYDYKKPYILSNRLNFDIIGFMDETKASNLKEKDIYYVFGKKMKRLNKTETFLLVSQVYYSQETKIDKDAIWDVYNFYIGNILCEIDSVKTVKR